MENTPEAKKAAVEEGSKIFTTILNGTCKYMTLHLTTVFHDGKLGVAIIGQTRPEHPQHPWAGPLALLAIDDEASKRFIPDFTAGSVRADIEAHRSEDSGYYGPSPLVDDKDFVGAVEQFLASMGGTDE